MYNAKIKKYSRSFSFNFKLEKSFYSFFFVRNHTTKNLVARYHGKKGEKEGERECGEMCRQKGIDQCLSCDCRRRLFWRCTVTALRCTGNKGKTYFPPPFLLPSQKRRNVAEPLSLSLTIGFYSPPPVHSLYP